MTSAPLPYTADGNSLRDARGNVIAVFRDHRDAEALVTHCNALQDHLDKLQEVVDDALAELERLKS